jgi:hypothetical protein
MNAKKNANNTRVLTRLPMVSIETPQPKALGLLF